MISTGSPKVTIYEGVVTGADGEARETSCELTATMGTTQGSPEGGVSYNTVHELAVKVVRTRHPPVMSLGIYDDWYLFGPTQDVIAAYHTYTAECLKLGEKIQSKKSRALPGAAMTAEEQAQLTAALEPLAIPTGGIVAGGIPIGDTAFVTEHLKGAFKEANDIINKIHRVMVSAQRIKPRIVQDLYKITRWCLSPAKINHYLRCIPKATLLPFIQEYDEAIYRLTLTITSLDPTTHSSDTPRGHLSKLIGQLPARMGGLGLASAVATADAQRSGNLALTAHLVAEALGSSFNPETHGKIALPELYTLFGEERVKDVPGLLPPEEMWKTPLRKVASHFNTAAHKQALENVLTLTPSRENKAYLLSGGEEGAAWLLSYEGKRLTDPEFQALLRARILAPPRTGTPPEGPCRRCGKPDGGIGVHALECTKVNQGPLCAKNNWSSRHAAVKAAIAKSLNRAIKKNCSDIGLIPMFEPYPVAYWPVKVPGIEANEAKSDLLFNVRMADGKVGENKMLADVAVTQAGPTRGGLRATRADGGAASGEAKERSKEKKYNDLFHVPLGANVPLVLETGGRMTENTRRALSTYIRWHIMGIGNDVEWTPHQLARYNVYWRDLIDATVVSLVKEVAGALLDNCTIRENPAPPHPLSRGTSKAPAEMDVDSEDAQGGA